MMLMLPLMMMKLKQCFSHILSCSQSGDHPEENLTKFGYKSDMKV
jgi:hypothetical protein